MPGAAARIRAQKEIAFSCGAFAVRQVEVRFSQYVGSLLGLTVSIYANSAAGRSHVSEVGRRTRDRSEAWLRQSQAW